MLWKNLLTSTLAFTRGSGGAGAGVVAADVGVAAAAAGGGVDVLGVIALLGVKGLAAPFTGVVVVGGVAVFVAGVDEAGTEPKAVTPCGLSVGTLAGDEDSGAEESAIEPNVTEGACFMALAFLWATETPSLI